MRIKRYSYMGSKVILAIPEHLAIAYNQAIEEWFKAQKRFEEKYGRKVTSKEIFEGKLELSLTEVQFAAFNGVSETMNHLYDTGLTLTEADCPSDFLIEV